MAKAKAQAVGPETAAPEPPTLMKKPGIVPLYKYAYDPRRALHMDIDIRTMVLTAGNSGYIKPIQMNPVYGIFQYKSKDGRCAGVIEGGFLWQYMHDFCGGIIVSSAWATGHQTRVVADSWAADHYWKRPQFGMAEQNNQVAVDEINTMCHKKSWPQWADKVPSVAPYVETDELSDQEALAIMEKSVGAAILSIAACLSRTGVFAADRIERAQTKAAMERAIKAPHYYAYLPTYGSSPNYRDAGNVPRLPGIPARIPFAPSAWSEVLNKTKCRGGAMPSYNNSNSGNMVAMQWLVVDKYTDPSHLHSSDASGTAWKLPPAQRAKLLSGETYPLLPQGVFHNG